MLKKITLCGSILIASTTGFAMTQELSFWPFPQQSSLGEPSVVAVIDCSTGNLVAGATKIGVRSSVEIYPNTYILDFGTQVRSVRDIEAAWEKIHSTAWQTTSLSSSWSNTQVVTGIEMMSSDTAPYLRVKSVDSQGNPTGCSTISIIGFGPN